MLGITEKYNKFKESTYFAGGKFVIYSLGIYLAATFTVGCLGAVIGFPLLTFPLAMLISNPVVWVLMGIILTVAYKMVVEPLFHLAKNYINGKGAGQGEQKTQDGDSGIVPGSKPGSENSSRRSSITSKDSGLGGKEFSENLQTLVHQTNRGNYTYWLADNDIADIARVVYGYSQSEHSNNVHFLAPGYSNGWNEITKEFLQSYRDKLEQNHKLIFTSILHINNNHWVTLVIKPDPGSKKLKAYYCDSFGNPLSDNISALLQEVLKIDKGNIRSFEKTKQQEDTWNCGIFALENAHKITQMFNEGKSFKDIDKKLSEYKFDLNEKRREFAEALMKDEEWREHLEKGLLCKLPPRTEISPSSTPGVQQGWCSIM